MKNVLSIQFAYTTLSQVDGASDAVGVTDPDSVHGYGMMDHFHYDLISREHKIYSRYPVDEEGQRINQMARHARVPLICKPLWLLADEDSEVIESCFDLSSPAPDMWASLSQIIEKHDGGIISCDPRPLFTGLHKWSLPMPSLERLVVLWGGKDELYIMHDEQVDQWRFIDYALANEVFGKKYDDLTWCERSEVWAWANFWRFRRLHRLGYISENGIRLKPSPVWQDIWRPDRGRMPA